MPTLKPLVFADLIRSLLTNGRPQFLAGAELEHEVTGLSRCPPLIPPQVGRLEGGELGVNVAWPSPPSHADICRHK